MATLASASGHVGKVPAAWLAFLSEPPPRQGTFPSSSWQIDSTKSHTTELEPIHFLSITKKKKSFTLGAKPICISICTIGFFLQFIFICVWEYDGCPHGTMECQGQGTEAHLDGRLRSAPGLSNDQRQDRPLFDPDSQGPCSWHMVVPSHALPLFCLGLSQCYSPSLILCHPSDESLLIPGQGL